MKALARRALVLVGVAAAAGCARPPVVRPVVAAKGPTVRVLTFNVNFGIAGDAETIAAIRDARADLVLLQETNAAWERSLRASLADVFPQMTFQNRGGAGGLAVLSHLPVSKVEILPPAGEGWFPAARIVVETPFGPLQALSVHLRPPVSDGGSFVSGMFTTPAVRAAEIHAFFVKLATEIPTVVAGDFNEEENGDVATFLAEKGMLSALGRFAPGVPTWRWPTPVGTLHKQLDHVFYDQRLDVVSAEIRQAGRSDHLPVIAVLARNQRN